MSPIVRVTIGRRRKEVNSLSSKPRNRRLDRMDYSPQELFGQHLVVLRKKRGWSQEKLALESGLARSYIGGIERGQRNLALNNICILAHTLGVHPREMLDFFPAATSRKGR